MSCSLVSRNYLFAWQWRSRPPLTSNLFDLFFMEVCISFSLQFIPVAHFHKRTDLRLRVIERSVGGRILDVFVEVAGTISSSFILLGNFQWRHDPSSIRHSYRSQSWNCQAVLLINSSNMWAGERRGQAERCGENFTSLHFFLLLFFDSWNLSHRSALTVTRTTTAYQSRFHQYQPVTNKKNNGWWNRSLGSGYKLSTVNNQMMSPPFSFY